MDYIKEVGGEYDFGLDLAENTHVSRDVLGGPLADAGPLWALHRVKELIL